MTNDTINELIGHAKDHLWMSHNQFAGRDDPNPLGLAVKGEGCYVIDSEGNRYLDATGGSHCCLVGHGRREIADAVYEQMLNLQFSGSGLTPFTNVPTAKLSRKLAELTPGDLSRSFYTLSGSEAIEAALKIVRQYHAQNGNPRKYKVLYRNYSHHGYTWGAMSVSGDPAIRSLIFEPTIPMGVMVPEANPYRCIHCTGTCNLGCARSIEATIEFEDPDSIAAMVVEPVPKGALMSPPEYWDMIKDLCAKHDILLIADEVVTAFGRTGTWFGGDHYALQPDLLVLGKTLGSGYQPIGAVVATDRIFERFLGDPDKTLLQSHTLSSHPVVSIAALTNLEIIQRERLVERSANLAPFFKSQLETLKEHSTVGEVRAIGLLAEVELVKANGSKQPLGGKEVGRRLTRFMVDNGLYMRCSGERLSIHPPLTITEDEIREMVDIFDKTLTYAETEILTT